MGIGTSKQGRGTGLALGPRGLDAPIHQPAERRGSAIALAVVEHRIAELQSQPAASGAPPQVQIEPLPAGFVALIDRIFISCTSAGATTASVFVGGTNARQQRDHAPDGNLNVADLDPPIYVGPTQPFIIRWNGADIGSIGVANVQLRVCQVHEIPADRAAGAAF